MERNWLTIGSISLKMQYKLLHRPLTPNAQIFRTPRKIFPLSNFYGWQALATVKC